MEMIERVAKSQSDFDGRPWLSMSKADRQRYIDRAKAAIEALREPTDAMEDAADDPIHEELKKQKQYTMERYGTIGFASSPFSVLVWKAMIAAALIEHDD